VTNDTELSMYVDYFTSELQAVAQLEDRLFRKILIVTMIDSWSRAVYPDEVVHRKRFTDFVRNYSDWEDVERVNPCHLRQLLDGHGDEADSKLRVETQKIVAGRRRGKMVGVSKDP